MRRLPALLLLILGAPAAVESECLSIVKGATGTSCTALSSCTDEAPFGMGPCKTSVPASFYCGDFLSYGDECHACSCKAGCEADGGGGTPQDWRPGDLNPYGGGTSANGGPMALSTAQQNDIVAQHNFVRKYHGACPLQWSDAIAQNVADVAKAGWSSCTMEHTANSRADSNPGGFTSLGENLATQSSGYHGNNFPVALKTMAWYLEEYDWDYSTSSTKNGGGATGHFTQVVWKASTHIGCQMYQCDYEYGKKVLLACQYGPAGNYVGQEATNVGQRGQTPGTCTSCGGDTGGSDTGGSDTTSADSDTSGSDTTSPATSPPVSPPSPATSPPSANIPPATPGTSPPTEAGATSPPSDQVQVQTSPPTASTPTMQLVTVANVQMTLTTITTMASRTVQAVVATSAASGNVQVVITLAGDATTFEQVTQTLAISQVATALGISVTRIVNIVVTPGSLTLAFTILNSESTPVPVVPSPGSRPTTVLILSALAAIIA